jgi:hypothetical protein
VTLERYLDFHWKHLEQMLPMPAMLSILKDVACGVAHLHSNNIIFRNFSLFCLSITENFTVKVLFVIPSLIPPD